MDRFNQAISRSDTVAEGGAGCMRFHFLNSLPPLSLLLPRGKKNNKFTPFPSLSESRSKKSIHLAYLLPPPQTKQRPINQFPRQIPSVYICMGKTSAETKTFCPIHGWIGNTLLSSPFPPTRNSRIGIHVYLSSLARS